jgi:DNA polymerase-3 subunit gamma/tau
MRDALSLLDQAIAYGGGRLQDEETARMMGSVDHAHIVRLVEALAAGDAAELLDIVRELAAQARNLETVLTELAEVLHRVGLLQLAPEYRDPERSDWESVQALTELLTPEDVQLFYEVAVHGRRDLGLAPDERTGLEMTLLRMLAFRPEESGSSGQAPGNQGAARGSAGGRQRAGGAPAAVASAADSGGRNTPTVSHGPSAIGASAASAVLETDEPPTTASKPAASPPGSDTGRATGSADEEWHRLLPSLELTGPVRELARNIQLQSRDGDDWCFLIPDEVGHLGSSTLLGQLQSALSSQIGHAVNVDLRQVSEPLRTPAAVSEQAEVRRRSEAEHAIEQDPTVRTLRDRFGAHIIEDSVQPLQ